ncbi:MAG: Nif11-like leader peptide family RiPP precursor [Acidobacteriota bacterium]
MSADKALAFLNEVSKSEELQEQVGRISGDGAAAIARLATEHGYDCTADEAASVRSSLEAQLVQDGVIDGEISDEDLEAVAGGKGGSLSSTGGLSQDASAVYDEMRRRMGQNTMGIADGGGVERGTPDRGGARAVTSPNSRASGTVGNLGSAPSWLTW